jgi:hypothetical protein
MASVVVPMLLETSQKPFIIFRLCDMYKMSVKHPSSFESASDNKRKRNVANMVNVWLKLNVLESE